MGGYQTREKNQHETLLWDGNKEFVELGNKPKKPEKPSRNITFDKNGRWVPS